MAFWEERMTRKTSRLLCGITLASSLLLPTLSAANTNSASDWGSYPVGFREIDLGLVGSRGEARPLHLMIWYPAHGASYRSGAPAQ